MPWLASTSTFQPNSAPPSASGKTSRPDSPSATRTPSPSAGPCTGMGAEGCDAAAVRRLTEAGGPTLEPDMVRSKSEAGEHGFRRSEEHTSELQSLMRRSYAVFCLKQKKREM